MVDDWSSSAAFRDIVIVGGGCYGTFYTGQLLRAAERDRGRRLKTAAFIERLLIQ